MHKINYEIINLSDLVDFNGIFESFKSATKIFYLCSTINEQKHFNDLVNYNPSSFQLPLIGQSDHNDLANVLHVNRHLRAKCVNICLVDKSLDHFARALVSFIYSDLKFTYLPKRSASSRLTNNSRAMKSNGIRKIFSQNTSHRLRAFYFKRIFAASNSRLMSHTRAQNLHLTLKNNNNNVHESEMCLNATRFCRRQQEIIYES